jgi:hypothetical protein
LVADEGAVPQDARGPVREEDRATVSRLVVFEFAVAKIQLAILHPEDPSVFGDVVVEQTVAHRDVRGCPLWGVAVSILVVITVLHFKDAAGLAVVVRIVARAVNVDLVLVARTA